MSRRPSLTNDHAPNHATTDASVTNGHRRARPAERAADAEREVYVVIGSFSSAEILERVDRGDFVRAYRHCDPSLPRLIFGRDAHANGVAESIVPIAGVKDRDTGRMAPGGTRAHHNGAAKRTRVDPLDDKASDDQFAARVRSDVTPQLTVQPIRDFVLFCLEKSRWPLTAAQATDGAGVDPVKLVDALAADGLPRAEEIILWCRLLRAAWFLTLMPGRSGEKIARALHFDTGRQLSLTMERVTRMRSTDVRAKGGFTLVMKLLVATLTKVRSTQVGPPAPTMSARA